MKKWTHVMQLLAAFLTFAGAAIGFAEVLMRH